MSGVLTDLDWMRVLGTTASEPYNDAIEGLLAKIKHRAEEVRAAKQAGEMDRDEGWEVAVEIPPTAGAVEFIAGLPGAEDDGDEPPPVRWDADRRELVATAELSARDEAQLMAGGADPSFREAITQLYEQSSVLKVSIAWLLAFYLVITIGELCLSPVGLSLVTKSSPAEIRRSVHGVLVLHDRGRLQLPGTLRRRILGADDAGALLYDLRRAGDHRDGDHVAAAAGAEAEAARDSLGRRGRDWPALRLEVENPLLTEQWHHCHRLTLMTVAIPT